MVTQCVCETFTNAEWSSEDCTLVNQMVRKCGITYQLSNLNHLYFRTGSPAAPAPGLILLTPSYLIQNDLLLLVNNYFLTTMLIIFQKIHIYWFIISNKYQQVMMYCAFSCLMHCAVCGGFLVLKRILSLTSLDIIIQTSGKRY